MFFMLHDNLNQSATADFTKLYFDCPAQVTESKD